MREFDGVDCIGISNLSFRDASILTGCRKTEFVTSVTFLSLDTQAAECARTRGPQLRVDVVIRKIHQGRLVAPYLEGTPALPSEPFELHPAHALAPAIRPSSQR